MPKIKYVATSPTGLLQPLPIPQQIWEDLSIDFITGLPKVCGTDTILVIIDHLSKYGHFLTIRYPYMTKDVTDVFIKKVVCLNRFSSIIVTN